MDPKDRELEELRADVSRLWLSLPPYVKVSYEDKLDGSPPEGVPGGGMTQRRRRRKSVLQFSL